MYTKFINPKNSTNRANYDNKGSSLRTVNYLSKEQKTDGDLGCFFNDVDGIFYTKEEVVSAIDNNVKGLKSDDEKFQSIVLSPSQDELLWIGNDDTKLMQYCRQVVENYAQNFKLYDKPKYGKPVKLVAFGSANYMFQEKSKKSFYVTYADHKGTERTCWGVDLARAVDSFNVGDLVHISKVNSKAVTVLDEDLKSKQAVLNSWNIINDKEAQEINAANTLKKSDLKSNDLVWFGTIHHSREVKPDEVEVHTRVQYLRSLDVSLGSICENKSFYFPDGSAPNDALIRLYYNTEAPLPGTLKHGDNRHIHIIVSKRDKQMKQTLDPKSIKRFNRVDFMQMNEFSLSEMFGFPGRSEALFINRKNKLEKIIDEMKIKFSFSDSYFPKERIFEAFETADDKDKFYRRFFKMKYRIEKGFPPNDVIEYLNGNEEKRKPLVKIPTHSIDAVLAMGNKIAGVMDDSQVDFTLPNSYKRFIRRRKAAQRDQEQSR